MIDGCLEGFQKFGHILFVDVFDVDGGAVFGYGFHEEFHGVGDFDGVGAVGSEKELGVVEAVEIIDGGTGAEFDAFDFLQVDKIDPLAVGGYAAETEATEALSQYRIQQIAVKQGGRTIIIDGIVAFFASVVDDAAAV